MKYGSAAMIGFLGGSGLGALFGISPDPGRDLFLGGLAGALIMFVGLAVIEVMIGDDVGD